MAILAFQKPDKVIMLNSSEIEGQFEFRPLEPGYGITIGNALRRILLNSLEGFAITSVKIDGINHEFSTMKGVVEDMTEIILNLKQVRFKRQIDGFENERVILNVTGKNTLTAGDLGKQMSGFQVLNPDLVICNMESSVKLKIEMMIEKGRGYVPADENKPNNAVAGLIPIDAIYTPIKNVKYSVENFRVEQKTDYEKLIIDITTDGSIHPKEALKEATSNSPSRYCE
jgi:DNA-directed RNA polymerase subunit alpha